LRAHPDVKNGKKTEEQVFDEYNETLMGVHSLHVRDKIFIILRGKERILQLTERSLMTF
jgi:hypothetical protein